MATITPFRRATRHQRAKAARSVHEAAEQFHQSVEVICRDPGAFGVTVEDVAAWRHMVDSVNDSVRQWRVQVEDGA